MFQSPAFRSFGRAVFGAGALLAVAILHAAQTEVMVNVDVTPIGQKVAAPTPQKPTHYLMLLGGFRTIGDPSAGEVKPSVDEVKKVLLPALAARGYLSVTRKTPEPPELLLVVNWGSANPETLGGEGSPINLGQMQTLVGGHVLSTMMLEEAGRGELMSKAMYDDRYFVTLAAYDFKAANTPPQKKVLLWVARMSLPTSQTNLGEALPTLVQAGAPFFGRATALPQAVMIDIPERKGRVEIGASTVVGETTPAPPAPAAGSKKN
jgi:hypothetical protein